MESIIIHKKKILKKQESIKHPKDLKMSQSGTDIKGIVFKKNDTQRLIAQEQKVSKNKQNLQIILTTVQRKEESTNKIRNKNKAKQSTDKKNRVNIEIVYI